MAAAVSTPWVDIHCHGGGGALLGESVEGTLAAFATHRAHGVGALLASLVTAPVPAIAAAVSTVREAMAREPGILGVHLEGPFLAPERRGAHDAAHLLKPTPTLVDDVLAAGEGIVRIVTIAPELPGALDAIARFAAAGIVPAIGHTTAGASLAREAFDAGARLVTHAFNAMPGMTAREPGPVGSALADERVCLEVIADGIHVDASLIRLLFREAPGRVVLVSDAISAAGEGDGRYALGSLAIEVREGRAVLEGTQTLAGSTLTLERAVEVCVAAGVPRDEAEAAASIVPSRVLGLAS